MRSKTIVATHIQTVLDTSVKQADIADAMGFESANYLSMLKTPTSKKSLLSPNRIRALAEVCKLSPREVIVLALARLEDAGDKHVEMSKETFKYLMLNFVAVVDDYRAAR